MKIFVNTDCRRLKTALNSAENAKPPTFVFGDLVKLVASFFDANGSFDILDTDSIILAIGYANGLNIVASTNTFTKDSDGNVLFELNLSTKNLAALISGKDYVDDLTIEIELTRNKQISTLLQFPVVIFNNAISSVPTVEQISSFESYKNACETAKEEAVAAKEQVKNLIDAGQTVAKLRVRNAPNKYCYIVVDEDDDGNLSPTYLTEEEYNALS